MDSFVADHYVRTSWIAFFTLWTLWGLVYFIRHAFSRTDMNNKPAPAAVPPAPPQPTSSTSDPEAPPPPPQPKGEKNELWESIQPSLPDRLARAHQVLFENSLLLLSVLVLNTFGSGATRAVMILCWIFFSFTVVHAFTEIAINHHLISLVFNAIFFGVTLAIGGLAFKQGW
ncbi:hypothetical protein G6F46_005207 [Rhizopus delemar]|uniref:Uncharacterized protein n=3 Tax=Rhizopus TaxID=4842 RepID=I1BYB5_RHIO9|nr:hypothetical protein RO3G_05900 [Rhizopus delemar RA 99-880]KAG1047586.1 hypothetical protein G6F43_009974 [Rhizopus delemar]KAG1545636.1 hypothetical protein G6F51_005348 [Rhizopus arrhizus]KAG1457507.1 hypothetical protein G6F55_005891 [Rhizopus delemar]KAG1500281.1 hypothetical protein G6F54_003822 [Rhizopus delemar]|eukprot:EIE81195.1 hypothetical protein RO3G_05900 [Rhizopus delemar RA 99-880]